MSEEVRSVSRTGGEKGMKAERHDLLPREGIEAIARVFGFGASKYADHNWRRGYEWSKSYAAMQRHLYAFWAGETYDKESGEPHLAHAGFHILVLLTWLELDGEGSEFDDRYRPEETAAEEEERIMLKEGLPDRLLESSKLTTDGLSGRIVNQQNVSVAFRDPEPRTASEVARILGMANDHLNKH